MLLAAGYVLHQLALMVVTVGALLFLPGRVRWFGARIGAGHADDAVTALFGGALTNVLLRWAALRELEAARSGALDRGPALVVLKWAAIAVVLNVVFLGLLHLLGVIVGRVRDVALLVTLVLAVDALLLALPASTDHATPRPAAALQRTL